jgi:hypothetical protein
MWCGWGGKRKIAMGISGLVEHRNSLLPLIDTRISKNDTLVSLISDVNWSAG